MQVKLDQLVDQANTLCQTDLEKVFYVHEWLVQNIAYDREHLSDNVQDDHNLRGACWKGLPSVTVTPKRCPYPAQAGYHWCAGNQ